MRKNPRFGTTIFITLMLLMAGGCAKNTFNYADVRVDLVSVGSAKVAVAVLDQRPYVVSGEKSASYVGTIRGAWGNPFAWSTQSGRPLAADMTGVIVASLDRNGYRAEAVTTAPGQTGEAILAALRNSGAEKLLLLTMRNWRSDSYKKVTLYYDLNLSIYDHTGRQLTESSVEGKDYLRSESTGNAFLVSVRESPRAFKQKIEQLLNNSEVEKALQ